jgi:hypothetical protein
MMSDRRRARHSLHIRTVSRGMMIVVLICLLLPLALLGAATSSAGRKVSDSENVSASSAIAVGMGEVAVAWAGNAVSRGAYVARGGGEHWTQSALVSPTTGRAWRPSVAYSGDDLFAVWTQGESEFPRNTLRSVWQLDVDGGKMQTVIADVYGDVAPDLTIAENGMHVVFAAAQEKSRSLNAEIYYAHRPAGSDTWSVPERIVGFDGEPSSLDGMWQPRIATDRAGSSVHIVWERTAGVSQLSYTTWYLAGHWQAEGITWATPQQVSPVEQQYAMRPDVAVDDAGVIHIVWTEVIPTAQGDILPAEAQHINHWRPGSASMRLNHAPIKVNSTQPTWASASIAAGGDLVCIGWHGYAPDDATSKEDIVLSCSRDSGGVWTMASNVSQSADWLSLFPAVALDADGLVHVSWVEEALVGVEFLPVGIYYGTHDTGNIVYLPLVMK